MIQQIYKRLVFKLQLIRYFSGASTYYEKHKKLKPILAYGYTFLKDLNRCLEEGIYDRDYLKELHTTYQKFMLFGLHNNQPEIKNSFYKLIRKILNFLLYRESITCYTFIELNSNSKHELLHNLSNTLIQVTEEYHIISLAEFIEIIEEYRLAYQSVQTKTEYKLLMNFKKKDRERRINYPDIKEICSIDFRVHGIGGA